MYFVLKVSAFEKYSDFSELEIEEIFYEAKNNNSKLNTICYISAIGSIDFDVYPMFRRDIMLRGHNISLLYFKEIFGQEINYLILSPAFDHVCVHIEKDRILIIDKNGFFVSSPSSNTSCNWTIQEFKSKLDYWQVYDAE